MSITEATMADTSNDKLFFFSKSADQYPGKGEGECVRDRSQYADLAAISGWRKVLSNFHEAPFKHTDGFTYNTIEHVFQGTKTALVDPDTALYFTVESGHEIGLGDGHMAQQHRMIVTLPPHKLEEWARMRDAVQLQAARSKYAACELARQVLLATHDAQLWHAVSRGQPERFRHLEVLRDELRAAGGNPAALVAAGAGNSLGAAAASSSQPAAAGQGAAGGGARLKKAAAGTKESARGKAVAYKAPCAV